MSLTDDEAAHLSECLAALNEVRSRIYPGAQRFVDDMIKRYEEEGADLWVSGPQWRWLDDLVDQYT